MVEDREIVATMSARQFYQSGTANNEPVYSYLPRDNLKFNFSSYAGLSSLITKSFNILGGNYDLVLYEKVLVEDIYLYSKVAEKVGLNIQNYSGVDQVVVMDDDNDPEGTPDVKTGLVINIPSATLINVFLGGHGFVMKIDSQAPLKVLKNSVNGQNNNNPCFVVSEQLVYTNAIKENKQLEVSSSQGEGSNVNEVHNTLLDAVEEVKSNVELHKNLLGNYEDKSGSALSFPSALVNNFDIDVKSILSDNMDVRSLDSNVSVSDLQTIVDEIQRVLKLRLIEVLDQLSDLCQKVKDNSPSTVLAIATPVSQFNKYVQNVQNGQLPPQF